MGSTFAVNKAALTEVGPFTVLAVRFPLALAVLLAVASRRVRLASLIRPRLLLFGVPLAVHFATQTVGLAFTTASRGALIVAGIPVSTAGIAALALRERLTFPLLAGITLSVLGVVVLLGAPHTTTAGRLFGDLLVTISVVAWAGYTVQGRKARPRSSALAITVTSTLAATVLLLPAAAAGWATSGLPALQPSTAVLLIYLGVIPSAVAFLAWNWALRHVPASAAGPFTNLIPVIGVAFALFLGERLTPDELLGAAIVGLGLFVASATGNPPDRPLRTASAGSGAAH